MIQIIKRNFKVVTSIFIFTFLIGGFVNANAYVKSEKLVDYKADYLAPYHETRKLTKGTLSEQFVNISNTTGDRSAMIALYVRNLDTGVDATVDQHWHNVMIGTHVEFYGTADTAMTESNERYLLKSKLALPWFQVAMNGEWVIDQ
ncbi:MAG: hypothetical protein PHT75_04600 [Bacilli bacterium]|nr:hypothetical protein [Bacilli bacterium]MDD3305371.1 hypothetical protein [Bacilli bacterium]MDD4054036.1 hypothetical protein [Bacilli bacterium]MDD4411808.1 hypothetical protein [Bacilli bacterium]